MPFFHFRREHRSRPPVDIARAIDATHVQTVCRGTVEHYSIIRAAPVVHTDDCTLYLALTTFAGRMSRPIRTAASAFANTHEHANPRCH